MLPKEFIKRHKVNMDRAEAKLCRDAIRMMSESLDVYHDDSHVFNLFDYLDAFMAAEEYKKISPAVDVKSLVIAILWHDTWKAGRDPKSILEIIPDVIFEGIASSWKFQKAAQIAGLDGSIIRKVKYVIRKHSMFQIMPITTLEAKIVSDIDNLDMFSLDRLYLIEKKYSCDRPFNRPTLRLAKFAVKFFVEPRTEDKFFFNWMKEEFRKKKDVFLKKALSGIDDYEEALSFLENGNKLEFERYRGEWVAQNITRPEIEKPGDLF